MPPPQQRSTMPETSSYYHLAYTLALGIYAAYALSLYVRRKRVRSIR
jgi:Mg2+ and Co2+ transporter CorA